MTLRSLLFAPANEERKVSKLGTSAADAVVLDLEDAVADDRKLTARKDALEALPSIEGPLRCVRINPISTGLAGGDIDAIVCEALDAILVPKVESARDLSIIENIIARAELRRDLEVGRIRVIPLIETCAGISSSRKIARHKGRTLRIVLGSADLGTDLGLLTMRGDLSAALQYGRAKIVYEARAAGLTGPIDGPHLEVRDLDQLGVDCRRSRDLGYTGKVCIHPDQVPVVNRNFAPDPADVEDAREVIRAFEDAEASGLAAIEVGGVFVDYPILYKARRILEAANAIADHVGSEASVLGAER